MNLKMATHPKRKRAELISILRNVLLFTSFSAVLAFAPLPNLNPIRGWIIKQVQNQSAFLLAALVFIFILLSREIKDFRKPLWGSGFVVVGLIFLFILPFPNRFLTIASIAALLGLFFFLQGIPKREKDHFLDEDGPRLNPETEDDLNRSVFAKNIWRALQGLGDGVGRASLVGDWGTGKTTLLNFIEFHMNKEGTKNRWPVIWFSPSSFQTPEEAWGGFLAAVNAGISKWRKTKIGPFFDNVLLNRWLRALSRSFHHEWAVDLFSDLLRSERASSEEKFRISEKILESVGGKRLLVFVDDLDRADPDVVYSFFRILREIIDIPGCVFLCAFDERVVFKKLREDHHVDDPAVFLEKIFQWRFELPQVKSDDKDRLCHRSVESTAFPPNRDRIWAIRQSWPENPRRLKNFVRHMGLLENVFLDRFGPEDLKWELVYAIELLKIRFPKEASDILNDPNFVKWAYMSAIFGGERKDFERNHADLVDWFTKLTSRDDILRQPGLPDVLKLISSETAFLSEEKLQHHLRFLEFPESLTWKEYCGEWVPLPPKEVFSRLVDPSRPIEQRREYLRAVMRERNAWLEAASNDVFKETDHLPRVKEATERALWLAQQKDLHSSDELPFDASVVIEWVRHIRQWAYFKMDHYKEIRALEVSLLDALIENSSLSIVPSLLGSDELHPQSFALEESQSFKPLREKAIATLKERLADDLISSFKRPGRFHNFFMSKDQIVEKEMVLRMNDYFHQGKSRKKLLEATKRAEEHDTIKENFFFYLELLLYGASEGGGRDEIMTVLRDDELREAIWRAATCKLLNQRYWGSLTSKRDWLRQTLNRQDILPDPSWVSPPADPK